MIGACRLNALYRWYLSKIFVFTQHILALTSTEKVYYFTEAVIWFHYFQKIWHPKEAEELNYFHELDKVFDANAFNTVANNAFTVGHLSGETSRNIKLF